MRLLHNVHHAWPGPRVQISHIIAKFNETSTRKNQKMAMVMQNLSSMSIRNRQFIDRVLSYYRFLWQVTQFHRRDDFMRELSPCLQSELNLLLNGEMVQRVDLFNKFEGVSLIDVVGMLKTELYVLYLTSHITWYSVEATGATCWVLFHVGAGALVTQ